MHELAGFAPTPVISRLPAFMIVTCLPKRTTGSCDKGRIEPCKNGIEGTPASTAAVTGELLPPDATNMPTIAQQVHDPETDAAIYFAVVDHI